MSLLQALRDRRELEYLVLGDLCELLQEPVTPRSGKTIQLLLETLLEIMPRELVREDFPDPLALISEFEDSAKLSSPASQLDLEYRVLYCGLRTLRRRLMVNSVNSELTEWLTLDIQNWMDTYRRHVRAEHRPRKPAARRVAKR